MMIAIVILGLGLIMVATIFPVAWDRARRLSESTAERSISAGAHATVRSLIRPSTVAYAPFRDESDTRTKDRLLSGSFAGDVFLDPVKLEDLTDEPIYPVHCSIFNYSDTRVHALHLENRTVVDGEIIPEDPWALERMNEFESLAVRPLPDTNTCGEFYVRIEKNVRDRFYFSPQVSFESRVHPPLDPAPNRALLGDAAFDLQDKLWNQQLSARKFSWAVLHRLQRIAGPARPTPFNAYDPAQLVAEAIAAMGSARTLDLYHVTLRRPNATKRYARQDARQPAALPNPYDRGTAVSPLGRPSADDVAFPVAWRVQVEFPGDLASKKEADETRVPLLGVPTEISVPPTDVTGATATMLTQMFPTGTRFVDEITGQVYRVAKRRVTIDSSGNQSASLTLDREVLIEDIDDSVEFGNNQSLQDDERLRTVWVYPPPVDRSSGGSETVFEGKSPVVNIDVRTISLSPSG